MTEIVIENDPEMSQNQRLTERQVVLLIVMLIFCSTPNKKNRSSLNKFGEFARNVEKSGSAGSRDTMGLSQLHKFCAFCDSFWRDNKNTGFLIDHYSKGNFLIILWCGNDGFGIVNFAQKSVFFAAADAEKARFILRNKEKKIRGLTVPWVFRVRYSASFVPRPCFSPI